MGKITQQFVAFNRGRISSRALARVDLDRTRLSAETQKNLIPSKLGSAIVRPGLEYIRNRQSSSTRSLPFVFSQSDMAEIEIGGSDITGSDDVKFYDDDTLITYGTGGDPFELAPGDDFTNQFFTSNLTGWTDADESGAASTWATGGYMALLGTGTNSAIRYQQVTTGDANIKHTLRIVIQRGPVVVKIGSSAGASDYFTTTAGTGEHRFSFTPTANDFFVQFSSALSYTVLVDSCDIIPLGFTLPKNIPSVWVEDDLSKIRWVQSADVVYLACEGYIPYQLKRYSTSNDSWSLETFEPEDGPFGLINTSEITMTPSDITGDITLTTNKAYWTTGSGHVGELFKLVSAGQNSEATVTAANQFTSSIYVTGAGTGRVFAINVSGSFAATVTLQRSEDDSTWTDVTTYTAATATAYDDELDNQQWYYRIGVKTGDYTSGTVNLIISYNGGSRIGIVKITSITSTTVANGVVLSDLGSIVATETWYRSEWSELKGYPSAVEIYESRLFWAGKGKIWGSVVDSYSSYDDDVEGDSGPINRTLGQNAFDVIYWMMGLDRLMIGTPLNELTCKSNEFGEPLSPTNFNVKVADSEGSANVEPVKDGQVGVFVQRSGAKVYQLQYDGESNNYVAQDLTTLIPEIGEPRIVRMAIQKKPDTRIHCVRSDGTVGMLVKDGAENVLAWVDVETLSGDTVTDVYVFPAGEGVLEDRVYYTVLRNGFYMMEKLALESEAVGGNTTKMVDSFESFSSPGAATLTLANSHFSNGETIYAWVDGVLEGPFTVSGSQITISTSSATEVYVGYAYPWQWKSAKLAYAADRGTALAQRKKVSQLGVIAENIHPTAFDYGPDFTNMHPLPTVENAQTISTTTVRSVYDEDMFPFQGEWDTDSRICLQSTIAKPCTLLGLVFTIETNDKT